MLAGAGVLGLIGLLPAAPPDARAASQPKPAISEDASAALKQMGQALAAPAFSFQARTLRVYAAEDGRFLHIGHTFKILVHRPDKMRVEVEGDDGAKQVFYDGKTMTLYDPSKKAYLKFAVPDTIEAALKDASAKLGFDFPLADFLTSAPHDALLEGVKDARVVNEVTIDGKPSTHLTLFQPPGIEQELWLTKDKGLPERVFITFRAAEGEPTFVATFADWNFSVTPTDADFVFQPPEGTMEVPFKPVEPAAANAKAGKK
ncbi:MAG TPA: DUF2092 domain-containing protein [Stellaceae bacterium]|nr:DUF2092 domain-containing protein [Stellaceae bacterium]